MHFTIGEYATAYAMSQCYHDEVVHAMGGSIDMLAQSRHIGIVAQSHSNAQAVAQHGSQGHHALPVQVGRILYATCEIVAAGSTDTHRTDIFIAAIRFSQHHHLLAQGTYIVCNRGVI